VAAAFHHISIEKVKEFWYSEASRKKIISFFDVSDNGKLLIAETSKSCLEIIDSPNDVSKVSIFYVVKLSKVILTDENILEYIIFGDLAANPIEHLSAITQNLIVPAVSSSINNGEWTESLSKDISKSIESFVSMLQITEGHVRGAACLPLPSLSRNLVDELATAVETQNVNITKGNIVPRIHELENIIILWAKQIKNVLKCDSDELLTNNSLPQASAEVDFWSSQSSNLNGIFKQLQNPVVRRIVIVLDFYKSTYNEPFVKLCKDVHNARIEANDILKYLQPLSPYLHRLENESSYSSVLSHIHPILRVLLTIYKVSSYYNTPSKLTAILRMLSNSVIRHTIDYLTSENISTTFVDVPNDACASLSEAIRVLNEYKEIFQKFQQMSISELQAVESRPRSTQAQVVAGKKLHWGSISTTAIFYELDRFLERCHDLLDLSQTISQFMKLSSIEIGGTKGRSLTATVGSIYHDFEIALRMIREVDSFILEYDNKSFESKYYEFNGLIKELDRRLVSLMLNGYDDAVGLTGKFRFFETFDNLVHRTLIYDAMEKKHSSLIDCIRLEMCEVERIFFYLRENPPVPNNLPPIAGALTWSRGLLDRIQYPIEKLYSIDVKLFDREDAKEVMKLYSSLRNHLNEFNQERIDVWCRSIEDSSQSKLKNSLLRRELFGPAPQPRSPQSPSKTMTNRMNQSTFSFNDLHTRSSLSVNFDPMLVRLLREVKYFLLLGLEVPSTAMEIYEMVEIFRRQTGNLELIVNMYNDIQKSLLPVERPLIRSQLDHIDRTLAQGVGDARNLTSATSREQLPLTLLGSPQAISRALNWKSQSIDNFIGEAMTEVRESTDVLQTLKGCLRRIEQIVETWQVQPVFERGNRTLTIEEFLSYQQKVRQSKSAQMKESGQEVHRLLKDINKKLKISQITSDWKAYIDFVNAAIVEGLTNATTFSLVAFSSQLNPKRVESDGRPPLLEIQLDLVDNDLIFIPDFGKMADADKLDIFSQLISSSSYSTDHELDIPMLNISPTHQALTQPALMSPLASPMMFPPSITTINTKVTTKSRYNGVRDVFQLIMNGIVSVASMFKRVDTTEGNYLQEVCEGPDVRIQRTKVFHYLDITEKKCLSLRQIFRTYEHLWNCDMDVAFENFLSVAVTEEKVPFIDPAETSGPTSIAGPTRTSNGGRGSVWAPPSNFSALSPRSQAVAQDFNEASINNADADFVCDHGFWIKTNINLDLFGEKISHYTELLSEISDLKAIYDVDFLKVNAQPVKQAIYTCATRWLFMYTQYLQDYLIKRLTQVHDMIRDINKGLDQTVESTDREAMMSIMNYIRDVRKHVPEMASLFDPLRSIVFLLKVKNVSIDLPRIGEHAALDFLEQAVMQWDNTINKAYRVKESIQPVQNIMVEGIKKDAKTFDQNVAKLAKDINQNGPFNWLDMSKLKEAYASMDKYLSNVNQLDEQCKSINELQDLFELPLSTRNQLNEIINQLKTLKTIWDMVSFVESLFSSWKQLLWSEINSEDLMEEVKQIEVKMKRFPRISKDWNVLKRLEVEVRIMAKLLPLISDLHSPAIRDRHWKQLVHRISSQSGGPSPSISGFGASLSFDDILKLNLQNYSDIVLDVVEIAQKELKIESRLNQIDKNWNSFSLELIRHRDTEVFVLSPPDDTLDALEENHLHLQAMISMGRYVDHFREEVLKWQATLGEVESTLKLLLAVSRQWGSLESIFLGSADIRAQLPDDTKRFEGVDNEFKEIMRDILITPGTVAACTVEGRDQALRLMFKELEKCEKALNEYLEIKKSAFPRFYFVSNAALLDILSNGNDPPKIMSHLGSIFDGIGSLELCLSKSQRSLQQDENHDAETSNTIPTAAKAMVSKDNEIVEFHRIFEMKNAVESWLHDLVKCMHHTLRLILKSSIVHTSSWTEEGGREEWIFSVPAQIALVSSQIVWTDEVESTLEELEGGQDDALRKYCDLCNQRLDGLIRLVQGSLSKDDRVKIVTVITNDVHNRDIISSFIQKKVETSADFNWQCQLRYYWSPEEMNASIKLCEFNITYSYEYFGNCSRLVITPLTDRCYVTLTTALRMTMGGSCQGPAGSGKTETTKDLARNFAVPCYVFNCSDQMNYQTMADIFKGLAQVGAWGCFDEFNRIDIEVLSVVASQVRCILDAISYLSIPSNRSPQYQTLPRTTSLMKIGVFNFFDDQISLIPTVGVFITMNPGYAGRTELPENLKSLFRPCAMVQPDVLPICENMLMAEGFIKARSLALKFVTLYRLANELLSKQHHYDWGLRAIKSVLRVAGILKRADPQCSEDSILMRALRDFNTPKIPNNDIPTFLRLIADLFPGIDLAPKTNQSLREACTEECKSNGLQADETFLSKILQFQELLDIRHSVIILGPAGCGKTNIWKVLAMARNLGLPKPSTVYDVLNPKVLSTDELYGYMTLAKDWRDGALSIIFRNMSMNYSPYHHSQTSKWLVLDGDIDASWIESMNTVMDDNKVLTLVSNERIAMDASMRLIFEVNSLSNATPATVSRAGILYVNESDIGYHAYLDSWLASQVDTERPLITDIFDRYLHKVIEFFVSSRVGFIVNLPMINIIQTLCYLMEGMLKSFTGEKSSAVLERIFLYCLIWSFGGALASDKPHSLNDNRRMFNVFIKNLVKSIRFPDNGQIYDFYIDPVTAELIPWQIKASAQNPKASLDIGSNRSQIFLVTGDNLRLKYLINILISNQRNVMLVGSSGTGKSLLVNRCLSSLSDVDESYKSANIVMNFYTDSAGLQHQLEQHIDKRSGKTYGPPAGKLIYFVDDINFPQVEVYGSQTSLALLRQHIDHKSWFDRADLSLKKTVQNCQYIACMNHKQGSFQIDLRLQRHFATFSCQLSSDADLITIFSGILQNSIHVHGFESKIAGLADATVHLFKEISMRFLPSTLKFHYVFTLRDMSSIAMGLSHYQLAKGNLARHWYHEVTRVFSDRFIQESEVHRFKDIAVNIGRKYLGEEEKYYQEPCLFSYQAIETLIATPRLKGYEESSDDYLRNVDDPMVLKRELEMRLSHYNETHSIMNLVLFEQAIEHLLRLERILKTPGENAMLVGVGGSGKQSLCKLAAYICNYDVVQISITSDYTIQEFKENLRELYRKAGVKPANPIVFLLTDNQIIDDRFLVPINDFLSTGIIPELFTAEEYDAMLNIIRSAAKNDGIPDNRAAMMEFFITRVRKNLHLVMTCSPVGDSFRQRARKFPSIVHCATIDWYHEWTRDALISVAVKFLEDIDISTNPFPKHDNNGNSEEYVDLKENLAYHIAEVHSSVSTASMQYLQEEKRYNYVTPTSFLELISFYKRLLREKREDVRKNISRLENGLQTLIRTNNDVVHLQEYLRDKKKEVEAKRHAADLLLEEMGTQRAEAEAQQAIADNERSKADILASEAKEIEAQAAIDLAAAKPAMDAAHEAVNCLDKSSMTELKSFTKPPLGVDKVTSVMLIMIKNEKRDFSWENAKKMMAKVDAFKEKLETYPSEDIPDEIIQRVKPFLDDPEFTYERMRSKSVAAANLTNWIVNTIAYNDIYRRVKPLMESLEVASLSKQAAEAELEVVKEKLAVIESKLADLQSQFIEATSERAKVEKEYRDLIDRLALAERLTVGLASENERWTATVKDLYTQEACLIGDVMLAACFCSYLGAFNSTYRSKLWKDIWLQDLMSRDIPISGASIDPLHLLASDFQSSTWQAESLPADRMSIENGAITCNASRWPLLIDPQSQGLRWLKINVAANAKSSNRKVILIQYREHGWIDKLSQAVQDGDIAILENLVEQVDASLSPLLFKSFTRKGKLLFVKLGDEDIPFNDSFQLYLQTKLANPQFSPEVFSQCNVINFLVTKKGLEDQLLATIVSEEEPELERSRNQIIQVFNKAKINLLELEDQLLERLANAPEDILSDIPLIEGLEATKAKVNEINDAIRKSKITEQGINQMREVYRNVAVEASISYFLMVQFASIDHMYQFSLDSFSYIFLKALRSLSSSRDLIKQERVKSLQLTLRWTIFKYAVRGLFEKHRLLFLSQLVVNLLYYNIIPRDQTGFHLKYLRFLLLGPSSSTTASPMQGQEEPEEKSPIPWINDVTWMNVRALANIDTFEKFASDIEDNSARFLEWFQSYSPEMEKLPGDWRELDKHPFKKLLVIKTLRPDRMTAALSSFIREVLPNGKAFVDNEGDSNSYQMTEQSYEDSNAAVPIYFILSPGTDAASDVDRLAMKHGKTKGVDYHEISLGQGQDIIANDRLDAGRRQGHWIFFNNIHLMPRWLPQLEAKLEECRKSSSTTSSTYSNESPSGSGEDNQQTHPNFRIFLSSDPSTSIPITILDRSIKLTFDAPAGLKANLKQAVTCFSKETFDDLEPRTKGILFGLCHFHATMIERKKFGAKGFNMMYPFNTGDLMSSFAVLRGYMENASTKIPWTDLRYLFGEIMYGGHIINQLDRVLTKTYLDFFMREDLLDEMFLYPYPDVMPTSSSNVSNSAAGNGAPSDQVSAENLIFKAPSLNSSYEQVMAHIDDSLRFETPIALGLHANSEIGFRTKISDSLLQSILELSSANFSLSPSSSMPPTPTNPSHAAGTTSGFIGRKMSTSSLESRETATMTRYSSVAASSHIPARPSSSESLTATIIQEINEILHEIHYDVETLSTSIEEVGPYQNFVLQECDRMNHLISVILQSLSELDAGYKGELAMTEAMEEVAQSLAINRVPKRWETAAYASLRPLGSWLADLNNRISQLNDWSSSLGELPIVTWISGLFNPQSFLTVILQIHAQATGNELDRLTISSEITRKIVTEEITMPAKDGAYIHGLSLEGAAWNISLLQLEASKPKEMFCPLPVILIKPSTVDRADPSAYDCPVFKTQQRGPTYVFTMQLKSKHDPAKWILAGTAALMDTT
jgi:dynein heavy chain, axonemal